MVSVLSFLGSCSHLPHIKITQLHYKLLRGQDFYGDPTVPSVQHWTSFLHNTTFCVVTG